MTKIRLKLLEIQQKILRKTISLLSNNLTYFSEATGLPSNNYPAQLDIKTQKKLRVPKLYLQEDP